MSVKRVALSPHTHKLRNTVHYYFHSPWSLKVKFSPEITLPSFETSHMVLVFWACLVL